MVEIVSLLFTSLEEMKVNTKVDSVVVQNELYDLKSMVGINVQQLYAYTKFFLFSFFEKFQIHSFSAVQFCNAMY